jgi:signal transduction histidine kinase
MAEDNSDPKLIQQYIELIKIIEMGKFTRESLPVFTQKDPVIQGLVRLAEIIERSDIQHKYLSRLTAHLNAGLYIEEILDKIYDDLKNLFPYNRIGYAIIHDQDYSVQAIWAKSDQPNIYLRKGYKAPLQGSSLERILVSGEPRIINDLESYLKLKPESTSTRMIIAEGMRSSLTCPLVSEGKKVGFIFFSSIYPNTYTSDHVNLFQEIANHIAVIVEKGQLTSELVKQKNEIEKLNVELNRLNQIKNEFLAITAHDLRNPMSYIQLASSLLLEQESKIPDPDYQKIVRDIHKNAEYLNKLLNDLLDITLMETGAFRINSTAIPIIPFIQDTISYHTDLAQKKQIIIQYSPEADGAIYADPLRLRQVLDNLISNAIKFSPPESKIYIRAYRQLGGWRIEVKDQGPGLKDEDKPKIFKEYARLSARPTGGEKSTGLGLAITYRIIEAHGGEIGVEPSENSGSIFWFALPDSPRFNAPHVAQTGALTGQQTSESS